MRPKITAAQVAGGLVGAVILGLVLAGASRAAIPAVGVWLMDEGSGETATDATGNGNDGLLIGGAFVKEGKFGGALEFNGIEGHAIFNLEAQKPEHAFIFHRPTGAPDSTCVFWVRTFDVPHAAILWTREDGSDKDRYNIYAGPGEVFGFDYKEPGGEHHGLASTQDFPLDVWNHVALVRTENITYVLYVNGVNIKSGTDVDPVLPETPVWMIAGRPGFIFNGLVDEVAFFDEALSEDEVNAIMDTGLEVAVLSVSPKGKVTTAWGLIKRRQ
jgi:hypothetical protein